MAKGKPVNGDRLGTVCASVAVLSVVGMASFCYLGPYQDYQDSTRELAQLAVQEQLAIETRAEEQQNLLRQEELMERIRARQPRFDLSGFMSKALRDTKLDERAELQSLRPSERLLEHADNLSMVELKLRGICLADIVDLLHRIYASKNLIVLHKLDFIRPNTGGTGLDCSITFIAPKA